MKSKKNKIVKIYIDNIGNFTEIKKTFKKIFIKTLNKIYK